jgi:glycolate oxidase FAD binding subunit
MNLSEDQLARQLESELGTDAVTADLRMLAAYTVDGKQAGLFCLPQTSEQVVAALRICSEAEAAVIPWGGGTAITMGNLPRKIDVVLGLNRLNRVVEHDDANLTATVEAGIRLTELQAIVARQKQFLPFDVPNASQATVGGTLAANLNGPRRSSYGSVRDLVIGMKVALVTGEHIKAGGKVVKNVAGYDMCKLFVGSLGTLGVITDATLRMSPLPETAATLVASGTLLQVLGVADELSRSQLNPTAVFILNSQANESKTLARFGRGKGEGVLKDMQGAKNDWQLAVWSEGFEESVGRHLRDVRAIAERSGLSTERLRDKSHDRYWDEIRDFPLQPGRLIYRVIVPRASVADVLKTICEWDTADDYQAIVIDVAVGMLWIAAAVNKRAAEQFPKLIGMTRERRGHAMIFAAPPDLKEGVDVWGSAPQSLSLMREIKRQFDPKRILNPGRFVAGL